MAEKMKEERFMPKNQSFKESLYTTTTLSKVRGYTVELLSMLSTASVRTIDLVELTGKYSQYLTKYLYRMRNYGLARKQGSYWQITENGVSFLSNLLDTNNTTNIIRQNKDRIKTFERQNKDTCTFKKTEQVSFSLWLQNSGLSYQDIEKSVVEVVLGHYDKTRSKFILTDLYTLAKQLKVAPNQLYKAILKLHQDHIIYVYPPRVLSTPGLLAQTFKLGVYKDFLQSLECEKKIEPT